MQRIKILSAHDDYEEMMKGRQKELNSLKEMRSMTVVKRSEAVGKPSDLNTMGRSRERRSREIEAGSEGLQQCQRDTQPEMFSHQHHRHNHVGRKFT